VSPPAGVNAGEVAQDRAIVLVTAARGSGELGLDPDDTALSINRLTLKGALVGKFLAFDSGGERRAAASNIADLTPVSSIVGTLLELESVTAVAFRTGIGLGDLTVLDRINTVDQDLSLTDFNSPSQNTSNHNDYAPTGFTTVTVLWLSSHAARSITGLAGAASGRTIIVEKVGSFPIILIGESANSAAASRFTRRPVWRWPPMTLWFRNTTPPARTGAWWRAHRAIA